MVWISPMLPLLLATVLSATSDNVLLVVMDDISNQFVDVYGEGPTASQPPTPTLDRLASEGVRFTNAYANPLCSSTRATLLTGRYSHRTGIGSFIAGNDPAGLLPSEWTLPEALREAGYTSALVGKWHLGTLTSPFLDPVLQGFDVFLGTRRNIPSYWKFKLSFAYPWTAGKVSPKHYSTIELTNHALEAVERLPEPWFITLCYHAPHEPYHVPPDWLHSQENPQTDLQKYMAMVEALDTELGRLLAAVDYDSTTIIVLGDNGSTSLVLGTSGKNTMYEPGVNVPLLVAGSVVPPESVGGVSSALVNTTDVYESALQIGGLHGHAEDSVSLLPVLRDPSSSVRDYVLAESFQPNQATPTKVVRMARGRRYKLIRWVTAEVEEFYDLAVAPPGLDGQFILPWRFNEEEQAAYDRLAAYLDGLPYN